MKKIILKMRLGVKKILITTGLAIGFGFIALQWAAFFSIPDEVVLLKGGSAKVDLVFPGFGAFKADNNKIATVNSNIVKAINEGKSKLEVLVFGAIPVKSVNVEVVSKDTIYPSGRIIGMRLKTEGLVVVGTDIVKTLKENVDLSKESDILKGDVILYANGKKMNAAGDFLDLVKSSNGNSINITMKRGTQEIKKSITPVISSEDQKYHLGIWVRDGIAGLGTLTFITEKGGYFGSLGHGLMDVDTNILLPVRQGDIFNANVMGIKKSVQSSPGEIQGVITEGNIIGGVYSNCEQGVYGKIFENQWEDDLKGYEPAQRDEVKIGPAVIISNLDKNKREEYSAEITSVNTGSPLGIKGFVIQVTDSRLLEKTGGIVQGMSGSPVIQNGKIIGAVTHVIINDPEKGYGVFIDSMIQKAMEVEKSAN